VLVPIVLRDRSVALLYGDNNGRDVNGEIVAELSTLTAAASRSFQRLILRAKSGDYAKPPPVSGGAGPKLTPAAETAPASGAGAWKRAEELNAGRAMGRTTQPRFGVTLARAIHDDLDALEAAASVLDPPSSSAPPDELHDAPTQRMADLESLLASVERQDEQARLSADALVAIGERAAAALVARLPGPLRLDRHTLRGAPPPLGEHGPLLAVLERMGQTAHDPLLQRLGDASLEVRYYATMALGAFATTDVVMPLGTRLYDPDAGVRRAAVEALKDFPDSPELLALVEQLRAELPGPDLARQRYATEALGVLKDVTAVPRLIELVKHADQTLVDAARKALVEITKQDFGTSRWRWRSWWERHRDEPRVEWMLEGLGHAEAEVRLSAQEELRGLSNDEYFGYTFDGPKREREDARKKWTDWMRLHGPSKQQDKR
jgi:hypothetical protein